MRRRLRVTLIASSLLVAGCSTSGRPAELQVDRNTSTACNPMPTGSEQYWSLWTMTVPDKTPVILTSVRLEPVGRYSPAVTIIAYYAQPRSSMGMAGEDWVGPKVGVTGLRGLGGRTFAQASGLRRAPGTVVAVGQSVRAGVVLRANGRGARTWKGMDITYRDERSTRTRTVFDPIGLQVMGGVSTLPPGPCPDEATI